MLSTPILESAGDIDGALEAAGGGLELDAMKRVSTRTISVACGMPPVLSNNHPTCEIGDDTWQTPARVRDFSFVQR